VLLPIQTKEIIALEGKYFTNATTYYTLPCLTDIISALKSGDSPAGNGGSVDTSLSPNDLSNSTSSVVPVDRRVTDEEPEIFSKLSPGQFGPKGETVYLNPDSADLKVSMNPKQLHCIN